MLYQALVGLIIFEGTEEEKTMDMLVRLLNESAVSENDENAVNAVDLIFKALEERDPEHFAVRQYKKYKLAAGNSAKSILISCGVRLSPFDIKEIREITADDDMELEKIGEEKTAVFSSNLLSPMPLIMEISCSIADRSSISPIFFSI